RKKSSTAASLNRLCAYLSSVNLMAYQRPLQAVFINGPDPNIAHFRGVLAAKPGRAAPVSRRDFLSVSGKAAGAR
ncbi:hypothetical protein, partial [Erwinia sp. PsM31]|uniref:hypothetical protein n=1 Tax=Erwinia sp. PsM31 TaxID=3030535 RepID=UPI00263ACBD1